MKVNFTLFHALSRSINGALDAQLGWPYTPVGGKADNERQWGVNRASRSFGILKGASRW